LTVSLQQDCSNRDTVQATACQVQVFCAYTCREGPQMCMLTGNAEACCQLQA
jgi:hypothetical protein